MEIPEIISQIQEADDGRVDMMRLANMASILSEVVLRGTVDEIALIEAEMTTRVVKYPISKGEVDDFVKFVREASNLVFSGVKPDWEAFDND